MAASLSWYATAGDPVENSKNIGIIYGSVRRAHCFVLLLMFMTICPLSGEFQLYQKIVNFAHVHTKNPTNQPHQQTGICTCLYSELKKSNMHNYMHASRPQSETKRTHAQCIQPKYINDYANTTRQANRSCIVMCMYLHHTKNKKPTCAHK